MPTLRERERIMVSDAWWTANRAHDNQRDKRDRPYLMHIAEVAGRAAQHGIKAYVVALLHDVLEDSDKAISEDFPPEVRDAVDALTRHEGEPYMEYIERVKQNELARVVKACDLQANLWDCPRASLAKRYENALEALGYLERMPF